MNILDVQDSLKDLPDNALMREMQMPSGTAPQFLVLSELKRRKRMREDFKRQEAQGMKTVAEEAVTAAGMPQQGIMQMSRAMAPNTNVAQNTGMDTAMPVQPTQAPQPVQRMQEGGLTGSTISSIANLKVNYPDIYETVKDDPEQLQLTAEYFLNVAEDPAQTGLESLETPREYDLMKRVFADPTRGEVIDQQKRDARDFGEDYALAQRAESLAASRGRSADDPIFAEGSPAEFVPGTTGPTPVVSVPAMTAAPAMPDAPEVGAANITLPGPDFGPKTASGFGSSMPAPAVGTAPDVSELTDEQARRLYLAGREFPEAGESSVVDMLNRAREFQESDTTVAPEDIYDLGPRGRLKYESEGLSPIEQYREFTEVSNRLAAEAAADEAAKEAQTFAEQDARLDAQRAADAALDRRMGEDQPAAPAGFLEGITSDIASGLGSINRREAALAAARAADETAVGRMGEIVPFEETELGRQQAADAVAERVTTADQAAGVASTSRGGGGGGAGFGSLDSRIASMLAAREKQAESDKWMALAQTGLALMSSDQPTLGGAIGEAGLAGVGALQKSRQGAQDFETDMLKLQSELDLNRARIAAANRSGRSGGSGGGLTANQLLSRGNDLIKSGQTMLQAAGDNADAAAEAQSLIAAGRNLIRQVTGGASTSGAGAIKLPSAG